MILSFTEEQIDAIKLWAKFMIIWCIAYTFCHFFVWNPIKVEEMSELQHHKDVYVYDRKKHKSGNYSWMKLSTKQQTYQCECATYHCYAENYLEDKNKIDEVSLFVINKKYCFVVETINHKTVNITKRISYSNILKSKGIKKEELQYWYPKYLYSAYLNSYKEIFYIYLFLITACFIVYLHQSFFWVVVSASLAYIFLS